MSETNTLAMTRTADTWPLTSRQVPPPAPDPEADSEGSASEARPGAGHKVNTEPSHARDTLRGTIQNPTANKPERCPSCLGPINPQTAECRCSD